MSKHQSFPAIVARLKRAHGHLGSILTMFEAGRPCTDLAQQIHAVEAALSNAKRELIQDHIEHCLSDGIRDGDVDPNVALGEFKALAKYL